jgi:hypothetical protein
MRKSKYNHILGRLDNYLLIYTPKLWATKLHYLLFYSVCWFIIANLGTLHFSVEFDNAPNPEFFMVLLSAFSTFFYIWWAVKSRMLAFQKLRGITGRTYFLKVLLTTYFALFVIGLVFVTPYTKYTNRLTEHYFDKSLPTLRLEGFKSSISAALYYLKHPEEDYSDYSKRPIDNQIDFASSISDTVHTFRYSSSQLYKESHLPEIYLFNSGIGVDSIDTNPKTHNILVYFNRKASPIFASAIHELNWDVFQEITIKSSIYHETILMRTYQALSRDHRKKTPISIYYYKAPDGIFYHYCDKSSLQGSLLIDKMLSSTPIIPLKTKMEKIDAMVSNIQPLEETSYLGFIIALFICLTLTWIVFLAQFLKSDYIAVQFFNLIVVTAVLFFFLPSFGHYLIGHLWLFGLIIAAVFAVVYFVSQRPLKSELTTGIVIFSTLFPAVMLIIMAFTMTNSNFDQGTSVNPLFFNLIYKNITLTVIAGLALLIVFPWFLATRIYKLSLLPSK